MELEKELEMLKNKWKENIEHLYLLYEINRDLSSTLSQDELLDKIISQSIRVLNVEAGSLLLVEDIEGEEELIFKVVKGEKSESIKRMNIRLGFGEGIAGIVAQTGKPVVTNEAETDHRFKKDVDWMTGFKTKSILCVPMVVKERIVGVIELINKASGDFTRKDIDLLSALASQAAVAIENAKLYEEIYRAKEFNQDIIESMPGGFIGVEISGKVTTFNPRAEEILGLKKEDVVGLKYKDAFVKKKEISDMIDGMVKTQKSLKRQEIIIEGKKIGYSTVIVRDKNNAVVGTGIIFQQLQ